MRIAVVDVAECDEALSPGLIGWNTSAEIAVARRVTQCEEQAAQGITIVTVTTGGAQAAGRSMSLRFPQERHELLLAARQRQQTAAFKALYRLRSGVEGTCSQTTRNAGLRHARYLGFPKTHLQHILTAVATNFLCLVEWLDGVPLVRTHTWGHARIHLKIGSPALSMCLVASKRIHCGPKQERDPAR